MKKEKQFYLGMDVSKSWVDIAVLCLINHEKQPLQTQRFDNSVQGMKSLDKWLKTQGVPFDENTLMVIENTGVYHRLVWQYCSQRGLPLYIGNATHIKYSFGIARGKTDKVDAQRLCAYAYKHHDELKATAVLDPALLQLKDLLSARSRLIKQKTSIQVYLKELACGPDQEIIKKMKAIHKDTLAALKASVEMTEQMIMAIIAKNPCIQNNFELLLSVPGIGKVTALYLICCTANFSGRISGKQLSSYAGVAPFANSSGSSIKGRNKVHKMANKELKKLLHLGAMSAIRYHEEFSSYYKRKTAEGKHPLLVLNAVRAKIALRAVAVINKKEKYVDNYKIMQEKTEKIITN